MCSKDVTIHSVSPALEVGVPPMTRDLRKTILELVQSAEEIVT